MRMVEDLKAVACWPCHMSFGSRRRRVATAVEHAAKLEKPAVEFSTPGRCRAQSYNLRQSIGQNRGALGRPVVGDVAVLCGDLANGFCLVGLPWHAQRADATDGSPHASAVLHSRSHRTSHRNGTRLGDVQGADIVAAVAVALGTPHWVSPTVQSLGDVESGHELVAAVVFDLVPKPLRAVVDVPDSQECCHDAHLRGNCDNSLVPRGCVFNEASDG